MGTAQPNETARRTILDAIPLLRIGTSFFFVPCLIIITLRGGYHFLALVDLVVFIGTLEFYRMMEAKGIRPYKAIGIACALALSWYMFFRNGIYANFSLTMMLILLMSMELTRKEGEKAIFHISTTILGVIYVSYLCSHLLLLREFPNVLGREYELGASFVLLAFLITWAGDSMAYFTGVLFGRHRLLPRVSRNKTWEGSIGGLAASVLASYIAAMTFAEYLSGGQAVLLGLLAGIFGQFGDLVESMVKRDAAIKDASQTIPGHGGVLDRFDSLLFAAPLIYYFLKYVVFA